jgi:23S rRNA (uracil1939-C5)-methyltransferase
MTREWRLRLLWLKMNYKKIEIIDYTHDGLGIGKTDRFPLFIKGVAIGDVVDVHVTKDMKSYAFAAVDTIHHTTTIPAVCEHYETCGGCHVMHLTPEAQLDFKQRKVSNAIIRIAKLTNQDIHVMPANKPLLYRNKVRFHVVDGQLGYFEEKSHQLVPVTTCLVAAPIIMEVANTISFLDELRGVTLRTNESQTQLMVIVEGSVNHQEAITWAKAQPVTSLYIFDQELIHLYGQETYQEVVGELRFSIGPKSFFQIAPSMAYHMFETALSWVDFTDKHVVDLYSGVGVIGLFVAKRAQKVTMIESNPHAVTEALANIERNHSTNTSVLQGSVHQHLQKVEGIDVIIVDPPRSGLDKKTLELILETQVNELLYISCDPSTLARDLLVLKETYQIINSQAFDMFAQTSHVETAVYMKRKSS